MKEITTNLIAPLKTAVLFLVFNRPDTTSQVFEKIRKAKPPRLYVVGDGPREGFSDDKEKIANVYEIVSKIDWPCKVKKKFRTKNLGCKKSVSEAINWFFEHEEKGIILEDDCLPNLNFFTFCEDLLDRYSADERISTITGNNFQNYKWRGKASYYFSKFNHCWGWATWRRAWNYYQGDIKFWPKWCHSEEWSIFMFDKVERKYWQKIFDRVYAGEIDSWAYPWTASVWYKGGLTITPNTNLVSNIGFGDGATHNKSNKSKLSKIPTIKLGALKHPDFISREIEADKWTFNYHFGGKNLRFPNNWIMFPYRLLKYSLTKLKILLNN